MCKIWGSTWNCTLEAETFTTSISIQSLFQHSIRNLGVKFGMTDNKPNFKTEALTTCIHICLSWLSELRRSGTVSYMRESHHISRCLCTFADAKRLCTNPSQTCQHVWTTPWISSSRLTNQMYATAPECFMSQTMHQPLPNVYTSAYLDHLLLILQPSYVSNVCDSPRAFCESDIRCWEKPDTALVQG